MKSRIFGLRQNLAFRVGAGEAKRFLSELANISDNPTAIARFESLYRTILASARPTATEVMNWAVNAEQDEYRYGVSDEQRMREYWLLPLRQAVRAVWRTADRRAREWGIFRISQDLFSRRAHRPLYVPSQSVGEEISALGCPTACEQLLIHLMRLADHTRYCANEECPAPYFLARRRNQRYCSAECAKPAQRENKRQWWRKNGNRWRADRHSKQKKASRQSF
jgi:hypothetical protein